MPLRRSSPRLASVGGKAQRFEASVAALTAAKLNAVAVRPDTIPISRIRPNPFQARRNFDGLEDLAAVIREQGFTTRLRVRHDPDDPRYYQLVFGERRLRAAEMA